MDSDLGRIRNKRHSFDIDASFQGDLDSLPLYWLLMNGSLGLGLAGPIEHGDEDGQQ